MIKMANGNYDPIEQAIINALLNFYPVAIKNSYSDPDWTKGVKAIFGGIGNKGFHFELYVHPSA
jgi:hypothetical protein